MLTGWVRMVEAQQPGKVYRIGWLGLLPSPPTDPNHVAFRQKLRELGYVEGENLVLEYRSAGKPERRFETATELVGLKVDVIVTGAGPGVVRAAKRATRAIPIVMAGVLVDPAEAGFVASLARPGCNITGLTNLQTELHAKRLELLKEVSPRISRVAILWPRLHEEQGIKEVEAARQALGIQIQSIVKEWFRVGALESAFSAIRRESADALLIATFGLTLDYRAQIIEFPARNRMPATYDESRFVTAGGLMSYGADTPDIYRRAAIYVDRILKDTKPADLPVEQPTKFELVINLKTAKQIGLTISPNVLARANRVIR